MTSDPSQVPAKYRAEARSPELESPQASSGPEPEGDPCERIDTPHDYRDRLTPERCLELWRKQRAREEERAREERKRRLYEHRDRAMQQVSEDEAWRRERRALELEARNAEQMQENVRRNPDGYQAWDADGKPVDPTEAAEHNVEATSKAIEDFERAARD